MVMMQVAAKVLVSVYYYLFSMPVPVCNGVHVAVSLVSIVSQWRSGTS